MSEGVETTPLPKRTWLGYDSFVAVTFRIEHFEGPLDLLLQLVEQEKLDISNIALAVVADQFVEYVRGQSTIPLEEMADFLVIASKLVYLKSKLLVPDLHDVELEEGPDLETQLRLYRLFVNASRRIDSMWKSGMRAFPRAKPLILKQDVKFAPPSEFTPEMMRLMFQKVIGRLQPLLNLPQAMLERVVTVQEKMNDLFKHIRSKLKTTFHEYIGKASSKQEAVATFLAMLELVKQRFLIVDQSSLFQDIRIEAHPEAPQVDPFAESFV